MTDCLIRHSVCLRQTRFGCTDSRLISPEFDQDVNTSAARFVTGRRRRTNVNNIASSRRCFAVDILNYCRFVLGGRPREIVVEMARAYRS